MNRDRAVGADARRLPWTGERCLPWAAPDQMLAEHYHRYTWASDVIPPTSLVLDLASGEGYGSALLQQAGHLVTGVELDAEAVAHARDAYSGTTFLRGDITMLPATLRDFDVVVCFEALEHVHEQDAVIAGAKRSLTAGGMLLISTPNAEVFTHAGESSGDANPFHVRELNLAEFRGLLSKHFTHVTILQQWAAPGSVIAADSGTLSDRAHILQRRGTSLRAQPHPGPTYFLAVASDATLPTLTGTMMFPPAAPDPPSTLRGRARAIRSDSVELGRLAAGRLRARFLAEPGQK